MTSKQNDIDNAWNLYQRAMDACEDLEMAFHDLENEHGVDISGGYRAVVEASTALDKAYNTGKPILPPHSNDIDNE